MKRKSTVSMKGKSRVYRQLWRVVDGAVFDALRSHPEYLADERFIQARSSINKRVVGAVLGYAEQSARGRSEASSAAEKGAGAKTPVPMHEASRCRATGAGGWKDRSRRHPQTDAEAAS